MKIVKLLVFFSTVSLLISGCYERNLLVNFDVDRIVLDTLATNQQSEAPQKKGILLEDFTGVRCVNCPNAQVVAKRIREKDTSRFIVVAYHVTPNFSKPLPESKYNFNTQDGENIFSYLGTAGVLPIGTVDRYYFDGKDNPFLTFNLWETKVASRENLNTPINIHVDELRYNPNSREISAKLRVHALDDFQGLYFSALITEDGIIDAQENTSGIILDYKHEHVFRKSIQPFTGLALPFLYINDEAKLSFSTQVNEEWKPEKLNLVVFVHKNNGADKEILHVREIRVLN
jgi:hypothetical protein